MTQKKGMEINTKDFILVGITYFKSGKSIKVYATEEYAYMPKFIGWLLNSVDERNDSLDCLFVS